MRYLIFAILGVLAVTLKGDRASIKSKVNFLTDDFDNLFVKYAKEVGISPKLLKAISANESQIGKFVEYEPIGGTSGLMHIKLSTARDYEPDLLIYDMDSHEVQIRTGAKHLRRLSDVFSGDEKKIVMSYNQGEGNTKKGREVSEYWERYLRNKSRLG